MTIRISRPTGEKRKTRNTTAVTETVMILAFLLTSSLEESTTNTRKAKMRHMPMMVRKPKLMPVSKMGKKMFQTVYFLLRMR